MTKILAIIPARGGSKGVPRKNIKLLAGQPLIQYTIDAALESEALDIVMVSTEDTEIADISKELGADVPELRPAHLASDKSPTIDTVLHTLKYYEDRGVKIDTIMLLQPTAPSRSAGDIRQAIRTFREQRLDSLVSVLPTPHEYNPYWSFEARDDGSLKLSVPQREIISRRQDLPTTYFRSGDIYMTSVEVIKSERSLYGSRLGHHIMRWENHINIDTMEDWYKAEKYFGAE